MSHSQGEVWTGNFRKIPYILRHVNGRRVVEDISGRIFGERGYHKQSGRTGKAVERSVTGNKRNGGINDSGKFSLQKPRRLRISRTDVA